MEISNKQVVLIFVVGIALLLIAFWAGLTVGSRTTASEPAAAPAGPLSRPSPVEPDQARYVVVVGTFGTEERASEMARDLRRKYLLSAYTQKPDLANGERLFRVLIGPYDKRENAEQVQSELLGEGRRGVTIQKAN